MRFTVHAPPAFTFVEVLVAIVLLSVTLLALAASGAVALRQMTDDDATIRAATFGQRYAEQALASPCTTASAADSNNGVIVLANTTSANATAQVDVTSRHATRYGPHVEQYVFTGACY